MNGKSFHEAINDLWVSVQELAKDPSSAVTQGLFVEKCSEFLSRGQSVYDGLVDYQKSLNGQVDQLVYKVNEYADRIKDLNDQIRFIECGGFEEANDLRDERNLLIDELGKLASISYSEDLDSTVWIQFEGEDLVRGDHAYKILTKTDPDTGFSYVFWEKNAKYSLDSFGKRYYTEEEAQKAAVFDLNRLISSDIDTDIGKLKSTLLARGDHKGTYVDLDESRYTNSVSQSLCMNIMAEFDRLIHNVATTVNAVLSDAAASASAINPNSTYLRDPNGNPIQVFQKIASDGYTGNTFMPEDPDIPETQYTTNNLQINMDLLQQPTKLGFVLPDGKVDFETMEKLKAEFTEEDNVLNINIKKKSSFVDYYSDLVSQVANSGYLYESILSNQEQTVTATSNAREQIIGVSTDEELSYMIKFQNAYNAASRYINVVDEMLEHIVNTLGS
jgi:flagellar hook-associated protein 1 FlgK